MALAPAVTIATFPRDDQAFAAYVAACWLELGGGDDAAELERLVRRWHTRASVRAQSELAELGGGKTWYVYRDGRAGMRSEEGWWRGEGIGHVRFGGDGVFVDADDVACALVERSPGGLVGAHWNELVPPEGRSSSGDWLWRTLDRTGHLDSVFDFPLPTGDRRVIQYHAQPAGVDGEFESWWRELTTISEESVRDASQPMEA